MPQTYEKDLTARFTVNLQKLASQMEAAPREQWETMLVSFCAENNAGVSVLDESGEQVAGFSISVYTASDDEVVEQSGNTDFTGFSAFFENGGKSYTIVAYANAGAVEQVTGIFPRVFPYVLVIILVISVLVAFFYSIFLAKPIVDISNVSKRMTALDMTWRCNISRSDEIGVLAENLNDMAVRLDTALNDLQTANSKLQEDIDKEREQDKRPRDFFSAISHELKTPVTILKGELDGMILNVGKFKDRDKYLLEAYQTTDSIEKLVREILTLAKLDTISLDLREISLTPLVEECCQTHYAMAQNKHIEINSNIDNGMFICADKEQMRTVLSNIIGNAVKHSPEKSFVDIRMTDKTLSIENSGVHINTDELP